MHFFFFVYCFFVSSGDSSCRFVFFCDSVYVFVFVFCFFAKFHFLCSTRGHNKSIQGVHETVGTWQQAVIGIGAILKKHV
jgi:hypothetical protein